MQPHHPASKIQLLPEHIIDQIKAGEVIERPSTLLKEILENSIDAGADKIDIHLIDNGLELISLIDNGKGIDAEELDLAFCRHATSKIDRFEDIYHLHSYGFRGEALASIASISRVTCESQTTETQGLIKIEGGEIKTHQKESSSSTDTGTKLFIRDLFYNTPVRMKFIQSKTSEKNQLKKIINAFLLTHPEISFSIKWDDKEKSFFPSTTERLKRIQDVFFAGKEIHLLETGQGYDGIQFHVVMSKESQRGNAYKNHYLFVNDRYVQDIQMHKIIINSLANLWPQAETGHYFAYLNVPSDEIDVNIHPNKTVIKLFKSAQVFSLLSSTIKHFINATLSTTQTPHMNTATTEFSQEKMVLDSPKSHHLQYKDIDISSEQSFENYFENLHAGQTTLIEEPQKFEHKINAWTLTSRDGRLYLYNEKKLCLHYIQNLLQNADLKAETIPLLVSRPLKLTKKPSAQVIHLLENLGFEIDFLEESTLVIRAFSKKLQFIPYMSLTEQIVAKEITQIQDINFDHLELTTIDQTLLKELFKEYSFIDLIKRGLIKEVSEDMLAKLYEK